MTYIENRDKLRVLSMALNFAAKPTPWITAELTTSLSDYLYYRKNRAAIHERISNWDCGRQDAYCDSVNMANERFKALSLARKLQRGSGSTFIQLAKEVIGEN